MKLKVVIRKDSLDGGYIASCPAIPGCHTQGETLTEVRRNIREAINLCLEVLNDKVSVKKSTERIIEVAV